MKSNRVSVLATAAMLAFGLTACGVIGSAADDSPIVIGADLELTGPYAAVGKVYQNALQLEVAQLNAAGGAGGHPVQLVIRDNHSQAQTATSDIASLTQQDVAAIVTGACGECSAAVMKTLNAKQIPTISLAPADLADLTTQGTLVSGSSSYLFKLNPNPADNAAVLSAQMQTDTNAHKYAILATSNDGYGPALTKDVQTYAEKAQLEPVAPQQVAASANETGLRQAVHDALSQSPDAMVVSLLPAQATQVVALARNEDYHGPFYFDAIAGGDLFLPSQGAMVGVKMVAPQSLVIDDIIATSPAQTARKQWFAAYTSKYGTFSAYSLYAADAARIISSAVANAGGTGHDQLRNAIEATQLEGLSGPLRFTPDDHSGLTSQALADVKMTDDNRWHLATGANS
ncbi:ABC transporter substrate-binding protein [Rugosimonospora africana]|uniref:ABC transporter substrate-binding protein n=1 Tax=Rugosimonospora africana TaxID=556532 RepID=UPI0019432077|nr:ABC transporter substrate-binding protein [Rugosimonospora africana]